MIKKETNTNIIYYFYENKTVISTLKPLNLTRNTCTSFDDSHLEGSSESEYPDFSTFDLKDPPGSHENPRQQSTKIEKIKNIMQELSNAPNKSF